MLPAGLTTAEARRRLGESGPNTVAGQAPPRWRAFLAKFWSPIAWMLEAAIVLQLGVGEYTEAAVIAALLVFNATLGFVQEGRAGAALAALKAGLAPTALVRRDGAWVNISAAELVAGDVIMLRLGTLVPADATIVAGSMMVDQSALTGESIPVDADPAARVYAGSLVRRGQAVAEVTATGARTHFGRAVELVRIAHASSTEQAAILGVARNLVIVNATVAVVIVCYAYAVALPSADLVRLALTALLASIPVALPATFTLSAATSAQRLSRHGVLLTRLSAALEAAAMDVLCSDKTGTLTRNVLEVDKVTPMPGFDRDRVLTLALLASSDAGQDPIDAAIRNATLDAPAVSAGAVARFVPFDPATRMSEAVAVGPDGREFRIVKGAYTAVAGVTTVPAESRSAVDDLAALGHRVIAVAAGPSTEMRLVGLIALSDPPRDDSAGLIAALGGMGVRTVMVTGDSPVTAASIAGKVGIAGATCPIDRLSDERVAEQFGVFARVVPEDKYRLVKVLQRRGHVVGMCGDGANDAPALRQAQVGIAVSTATDAAKAAAGMVMTEPGLAGIVFAVHEGRIGFRRVLTYALNMLVKKTEIVLFLAFGLVMTGRPVMTPVLMVLMLMTNDFLAMSLTTDRPNPSPSPSRWHIGNITAAAVALGTCKLAFSIAILALGKYRLGLGPEALQMLAFVTLVFGAQAVLYVVRERRRLWSSAPGIWVMAASAADIAIASALALSGILMAPLPWRVLVAVLAATAAFALVLDLVKRPILARFRVE